LASSAAFSAFLSSYFFFSGFLSATLTSVVAESLALFKDLVFSLVALDSTDSFAL
jgi:hypothetical protein